MYCKKLQYYNIFCADIQVIGALLNDILFVCCLKFGFVKEVTN